MKVLIEGKAKKVFKTNDKNKLIQHFKDDATAFNNKKRRIFKNKGIINNYISASIFNYLKSKKIKTHFIRKINDREQEITKVKIIPIEVVVRNYYAGSLAKRFNIKSGTKIKNPIIELYLKKDALNDPFINDMHVQVLNLCTKNKLDKIKKIAYKVNNLLINFFNNINIILIDFKLEFGEFKGNIILADEISPDNCRLWDKKTKNSLDKDIFRDNKGDLLQEYNKVYKRIKRKYKYV